MEFLSPIFLSLELAALTTCLLLLVSLPIIYWVVYTKSKWIFIVEIILGLPLVLPPTVLGFYFLLLFGAESYVGQLLSVVDISLVFTFEGLLLASMLFSLPFMTYPIITGLRGLPGAMIDSARVLGKTEFNIFFRVMLPNIRYAIITASILTFAHTMGEFGVVLMIGGSIPGSTKVASIAIFEEVELMNYGVAHQYSLILVLLTFSILFFLYFFNRRRRVYA